MLNIKHPNSEGSRYHKIGVWTSRKFCQPIAQHKSAAKATIPRFVTYVFIRSLRFPLYN